MPLTNKKNLEKFDGKKVDLSDTHELRNWCRIYGVDTLTLVKAVQEAGQESTDIRKYLESH